jgi:homoprotocatechuate degradation regulator HpaR
MRQELRHRNLPQLLLQTRETLMSNFRPILNDNGLTEQQWRVIRALLTHGPLEPRQLCGACQILGPSLTGVLARMEEMGLVTRERMDNDQRRLLISLAPKSRQIARRMLPRVEAQYQQLEASVGVARLRKIYDTLDELLAALDGAAALAQQRSATRPRFRGNGLKTPLSPSPSGRGQG